MSSTEFLYLHKTWDHLKWMKRSGHVALHGMRWPLLSLHFCLEFFIMAVWAGFSCWQRNTGTASPKCLDGISCQRVQLYVVFSKFHPSHFSVFLCCWQWSKWEPPKWTDMRINCFLQVQRAIPAVCFIGSPLRFHMLGEICSLFPEELAWVLVCTLDCSGTKIEQLNVVCLPAEEVSNLSYVSILLAWWNLENL